MRFDRNEDSNVVAVSVEKVEPKVFYPIVRLSDTKK